MSYAEAFAHRDDEWSADMTADVPFYVGLARDAHGPIVELAVGTRPRGDRADLLPVVRGRIGRTGGSMAEERSMS